MKKLVLTVAVSSLLLGGAVCAEEMQVPEEKLQTYRTAAKEMFETLKGALQEAIKVGGPMAAIEVCNKQAPEIAAAKSQAHGFQMARTSLKPRKRAPDEWETTVMQSFEERKAAGEDPMKIELAEIIVNPDETKSIRYMKAIPTAEICLACHGADVEANLAAKIKELYPEDQATGYNVGDLRGAFTFTDTYTPPKPVE